LKGKKMTTFPTPSIVRDRPFGANTTGTVEPVTGLEVIEHGQGIMRATEFVFTNMSMAIAVLDKYASQKIFTLPQAVTNFVNAAGSLTLTTKTDPSGTLNGGKAVTFGFGTVAATTSTLATTNIDALPGDSAALPSFTSSSTIDVASAAVTDYLKHATAQNAAAIHDGSSTAKSLYINLAVPGTGDIDADATVEVNGRMILYWVSLHDGSLT